MLSSPALAQSTSAPETIEEVVVTGSRVITSGENSPTPLTVVSAEQLLQTTPTNVADALRKLPVVSNSNSVASVNNSGANNVGNFINLRGFGAIRTLVLFDGKRLTPSTSTGLIDTNVIPEMLLERVDVVTGGASAVYGSDAVTGVVNYVIDKRFTGLKLQAQAGVSDYGDGESWRAGAAWGAEVLEGRGHLLVSYEHFDQDGIDTKLGRKNGRLVYTQQGAGTASNPFTLVANTRSTFGSFGGLILPGFLYGLPNSPLTDMQFAGDGATLVPFVHGTPTGSFGAESGGDGFYNSISALTAALETDRAFSRFDYELTDDIKAYVQASWARSENSNTVLNYSIYPGTAVISPTNPYLSPAIQAQLGGVPFAIGRYYDDLPGYRTAAVTRNIQGTIGLQGRFGDAFDWDVFYSHGWSKARVSSIGNVNTGRLAAALDAVNVGGTIQCRVNTGPYAGCFPYNPFVSGREASAAINYVRGTTSFDLTNKLDNVGAAVTGTPFETWAGPVKVALSGEYRRLSLRNVSNAQPSEHPDCTGVQFCNPFLPLWLSNTTADADARQSVKEGAFEAVVPLLRDAPYARSLDLNGAVRYTHYSTSGGVTTWKVGGDWQVNDILSFRATRSRDIRAPNLNELFAPETASLTGFTDIHTTNTAVTRLFTRSNPDLKPEVAKTLTAGMVIKPAPRLSLSIDYYRINIANAIASVGGADVATQKACEDSGGAADVCAFYVRPFPFSDTSVTNFPTAVIAQVQNIASHKIEGVDTEINYWAPLANGTLTLRGLLSYQPKFELSRFGTTIDNAGVAGQQAAGGVPKWRATLFASYRTDYWGVDVQHRWRASLKQSGDPTLVFDTPEVPSVGFTDLTLTAHPGGDRNRTLFLSVQNVFNKDAPVYINPSWAATPGFFYPVAGDDDVIGRYFTAGARLSF
ncbi:TonB-dependent receptor domain-containing protein [Phenylobacterium sp.]|uniref:TonB-dependent receptor domain-containing protein n=1 Tax=Phenylobacterium sp. TaxID=1871053 RepID=UPI003D2C4D96